MKLFRRLEQSDYQDVLRVLGAFIDQNGYTDIRIIETDEGVVLQGRVSDRSALGEASFDTFLITDDDILKMRQEAFDRRTHTPSHKPSLL